MNVSGVPILRTVPIPAWIRLVTLFTPKCVKNQTKSPLKKENMREILIEMLKNYGLKEIVGSEHNPHILAMFAEIGYDWVKDDETAWCSAALNYFCKKLGYERSGKLDARSWLKLPVKVLKPNVGDIVVLWRESPDSWKGHVGLFINWDEKNIWVLGGNQSNMISISAYSRDRILGFRQAKKIDIH